MKTIFKLAIVCLTALTFTIVCNAADSNITVKVDGKNVDFPDTPPTIVQSRTLVPVRFIAEALGYSVGYNSAKNSAVIDNGRIVMYIGTNRAEIDGKSVTLDVESTLIDGRTMVPLRVVAETLNCTVDWFGTNRMIVINRKNADGSEIDVFERYAQSELFWEYSNPNNKYLVWKADYKSLKEASAPTAYHSWWIETPVDKSTLLNKSFDCTIVMRTFGKDELANVRDILYVPYPTGSASVYDLLMLSVKGELWETFYRPESELYSLYSAMPMRSGTFGTRYIDGREVEMYTNNTCTQFTMNISDVGYKNPDTPRELTQEEIAFYTSEAKRSYCLGLWGLN